LGRNKGGYDLKIIRFPEEILRQARELGKKLVRSWKEGP